MENEKMFEFMSKMYADMKEGFKGVNKRLENVETKLGEVETRLGKVENKIDHEITYKIQALFDGQKQTFDKLDRIEKEVSKHEEVILRRIK